MAHFTFYLYCLLPVWSVAAVDQRWIRWTACEEVARHSLDDMISRGASLSSCRIRKLQVLRRFSFHRQQLKLDARQRLTVCSPPTLCLLLLLLLYPFSRTARVSWYEKGKTSLDLNEARDSKVLGWQWHQLDHVQTICTSLQTDNHTWKAVERV